MQLDIEDIFAGAFGRVLGIFLFALSAIWAGSFVGALALELGSWYDGFSLSRLAGLFDLWASPVLMLSWYIIPNFGVLALLVTYLFVTENFGILLWGGFMIVESAFAMFGNHWSYTSPGETIAAWSFWLVLVAMCGAGVWLVRQMARNRWARSLAKLNAENARNRAEREAMAARDGDGSLIG